MKLKKYFRLNQDGTIQFSDKYDEELGFIGETNTMSCDHAFVIKKQVSRNKFIGYFEQKKQRSNNNQPIKSKKHDTRK